jgi:hypothetical protein
MHDTQGSTLWKATTILIEKASAPRLPADYAFELASRPQIERRKARFIFSHLANLSALLRNEQSQLKSVGYCNNLNTSLLCHRCRRPIFFIFFEHRMAQTV